MYENYWWINQIKGADSFCTATLKNYISIYEFLWIKESLQHFTTLKMVLYWCLSVICSKNCSNFYWYYWKIVVKWCPLLLSLFVTLCAIISVSFRVLLVIVFYVCPFYAYSLSPDMYLLWLLIFWSSVLFPLIINWRMIYYKLNEEIVSNFLRIRFLIEALC